MRVVDLFAGCGGLSLGFQNSGCRIIAAYDFWDSSIEVYKKNFHHPIFKLDLSDVDDAISKIGKQDFDTIIGGPPCQDFSHAGKRVEGERADLTLCFAEIISGLKPKWFLMENVDRIKGSFVYSRAREIFKKANYGLTEKIVNAGFCGVPQTRKRFICIGLQEASDGFLEECIINRLQGSQITVRQYFGNELGIEYYYRHPRNYNRRGIFSIDEPAPTVRGVNRPVPKGYKGHPRDPIPVKSNLRALTTLERARLQTFPSSFVWEGSKTDLEQMIGNAVPVKLSEVLADAILHYENDSKDSRLKLSESA